MCVLRYENDLGMPEPMFKALTHDDYDCPPGHVSISALMSPPRARILRREHDDEIVVKASSMMRMFLGKAVHAAIEKHDAVGHISETRLSMEVGGWTISGKFDNYDAAAGSLVDYKTTSVWSFMLGDKPEWEAQLGCYALLLRDAGFEVKAAFIWAMLLDWKAGDLKRLKDYPPNNIVGVPVPVWTSEYALSVIEDRVRVHQEAEAAYAGKGQAGLPLCTPEERWERPTKYAVQKPGAAKAWKLFVVEDEAQALCATKKPGEYEVVKRLGESIKCERGYCYAAPFCDQFKAMPKSGEDE